MKDHSKLETSFHTRHMIETPLASSPSGPAAPAMHTTTSSELGSGEPPAYEQLANLLRQELLALVHQRDRLDADIASKRHQLLLLADIVLLGAKSQVLAPGLEMSVRSLGLQLRTVNCLIIGGINTLGELAGSTDEELMALRSFGRGCLDDVTRVLATHGLTTGMRLDQIPAETAARLPAPETLRELLGEEVREQLATIEAAHGGAPLAGVERLLAMLDTPAPKVAKLWGMAADEAVTYVSCLVSLASRMSRGERVSFLEELSLAVARGSDVDRKMAVRYMGLDGAPPDTLDVIGAAYGVTRERVRQRVERFRERVLGAHPPLPLSEATAAVMQPGRAYALGDWLEALPPTLGPERPEDLLVLATMKGWGWLSSFAVHDHGYGVLVTGGQGSPEWLARVTREARHTLRPHRTLGAVAPGQLAGGDSSKLAILRAVLRSDSRWMAVDDEWFIIRHARKSLIGSRTRRMIGLLGPLSLAELRHGLRRDMKRNRAVRDLSLPPRHVLRRILRRAGCRLSRETGRVVLRRALVAQACSRMDRALLAAFADGREAVTTLELDEAMLSAGLSVASGRHATSFSPLLFRERHGVYSLLGHRASATAIDEAHGRPRPAPSGASGPEAPGDRWPKPVLVQSTGK